MRILNLTKEVATQKQIQEGVIEPREYFKEKICKLLTFNNIPTEEELNERAYRLSSIVVNYDINVTDDDTDNDDELHPDAVMLSGAPFFMSTLERWCESRGLKVFYASTVRGSTEKTFEDGGVFNTYATIHKGFVEADTNS